MLIIALWRGLSQHPDLKQNYGGIFMSKNKNALYLAQAAVIAALYTVLTYAQELFLPGTTSMAVQFRFSEALTMLALFTPAAIPRPYGRMCACKFSKPGCPAHRYFLRFACHPALCDLHVQNAPHPHKGVANPCSTYARFV